MRTTPQRVVAFLACVALNTAAMAQNFVGLGDLAGGEFSSLAINLSADGSFVTGQSTSTNGVEAFFWSKSIGMVGLGFSPGTEVSMGAAVSNDGSTVVGQYFVTELGPSPIGAYQWTRGGGAGAFNPFPAGTEKSSAHDISANGEAIVGTFSQSPDHPIAFHWSNDKLTEIADGRAEAVSADGRVVVGKHLPADEAFRWTASSGVVGLGDLPGGSIYSVADGVSADGQVVVGVSESASGFEAFRWTEAGGMVGLGDLPGGDFDSIARDTTADGSIVVGSSNVAIADSLIVPDYDAFIWDQTHGMRNLMDVLTNDYDLGSSLAGWNLTDAAAISDDGNVIVGYGINPNGHIEAWRVVLVPEPNTALLSVFASVGLLALRRCRSRASLLQQLENATGTDIM